MATSTLVPLSEYLQTTYRPDCEWIEGELRGRNLGELQHASVQAFFTAYFTLHKKELAVRVYPELRLQVSAGRYRIPDVMVVRRGDPADAIVVVAPLLCIEILSQDDRMSDMQEKVDEYLQMGVRSVWVVDPRRRTAFLADMAGMREARTELTVPKTEILIPISDVFAELDELEARLG